MPVVLAPTDRAIAEAARRLRAGRLVAFPTETVYGLGADASDEDAVRAIFRAKGRPASHPLIVHLPEAAALPDWVASVPEAARALAEAYWPGPLTLVLPRGPAVPAVVTGGQPTVAVRVPGHPVALRLLRSFAGGVAAPSANRFGRVSPTTAAHVVDEFPQRDDLLVLDGGACEVGVESTIIDLTSGAPRLLRPGGVPRAGVEAILGVALAGPGAAAPGAATRAPRVPGTLASHYAPRTPAVRVPSERLRDRAAARPQAAVLARSAPPAERPGAWERLPDDPVRYARELYAALRRLDRADAPLLLIEEVPATAEWSTVADRLARATRSAEPSLVPDAP